MYALSNTSKNSNVRGAVFKLVGEFFVVIAVLLMISQPFAAQAAPDLQIVCGEQGVLMVDANGVEQDQECPACNQCDECTTPNVRLQSLLVEQNQFAPLAQSADAEPTPFFLTTTALIHGQMLRGPPSMTSELFMQFPFYMPVGLLGEFS